MWAGAVFLSLWAANLHIYIFSLSAIVLTAVMTVFESKRWDSKGPPVMPTMRGASPSHGVPKGPVYKVDEPERVSF
jgi:hypothetical protein